MADAKITSFNLSCPVPRVADDRIVLAHGGGGRLTHQLIDQVFMPAFANDALEQRHELVVGHRRRWQRAGEAVTLTQVAGMVLVIIGIASAAITTPQKLPRPPITTTTAQSTSKPMAIARPPSPAAGRRRPRPSRTPPG